MQTQQGSLTIINAHTSAPSVFWNGVQVEGLVRIHVLNDEDDHRVKLCVSGNQDDLYAAMSLAGVPVKKVPA